MAQVKIGIIGCLGRMGRALMSQILDHPSAHFVGGTEMPDHPMIGENIKHPNTGEETGAVLTSDTEELVRVSDVILDFTCPTATIMHCTLAHKHGTAMVVGTTGLNPDEEKKIEKAAGGTAIVYASNYSLGVNLLFHLTRKAATILGEEFDIEISETHHRDKVDAPSGTALSLGKEAAIGRQSTLENLRADKRTGNSKSRDKGSIGFASLRGGKIAGEHTVHFISDNEQIELTHKASDRSIFASGAIAAALWASDKKPGLYDMLDVLGLINE